MGMQEESRRHQRASFCTPRLSERDRHRNNTSHSPNPEFSIITIKGWRLGDMEETLGSPQLSTAWTQNRTSFLGLQQENLRLDMEKKCLGNKGYYRWEWRSGLLENLDFFHVPPPFRYILKILKATPTEATRPVGAGARLCLCGRWDPHACTRY